MNNLPPGVRVTDIPGNRPEDEWHDKCINAAAEELPLRFEEAVDLLVQIRSTSDASEFADACNKLVNLFEPSTEYEIEKKYERRDILDRFLSSIEDAGIEAGYFENPPEQEYEADYDMGDF